VTALRIAPKKAAFSVARRLLGATKLLSSRLACSFFRQQQRYFKLAPTGTRCWGDCVFSATR